MPEFLEPTGQDAPTFSAEDVGGVIDLLLGRVVRLVGHGRRAELLNERFLHHMFSWELGKLCESKGADMWDRLFLAPECPSDQKFRWDFINLDDDEATRQNAVGIGKAGNLDFLIKAAPAVAIEWKGPLLYQPQDVVEVLLKLVTQQPETIKVVAAIITSSTTGRRDHMEKARRYFQEGVACIKRVQQLPTLRGLNLFAFIATVPDKGAAKIHWGPVE